jgi:hypothetical protein
MNKNRKKLAALAALCTLAIVFSSVSADLVLYASQHFSRDLNFFYEIEEPAGLVDPGFAYEDVDNDLIYTEGVDIPIPNADIRDGAYSSSAGNGLIIPPSVGDISLNKIINFQASTNLLIAIDLTSTNKGIVLNAGNDVILSSDLSTSISLTATNDELIITSDQGSIIADNSYLYSKNKKVFLQAYTDISAVSSDISSDGDEVNLISQTGKILISQSTIYSKNKQVYVWAYDDIIANQADIRSDGDAIILVSQQGKISLTQSTVYSKNKEIILYAQNDIIIVSSSLTTSNEAITITSVTGLINASNSTLIGKNKDILLFTGTDIDVRNAYISTDNGNIIFTAGSTLNNIFVQDVSIYDTDNTAQANPFGVQILGIPTHGMVSW